MLDIQFCLLQGLHMEHPSLISPFASPSTEVAAQSQDHIGWVNLFLGQLATEWSGLQHNHLTSISSHHTATSWATGVVLAISHSLWILQFFWSTTGHWKLLPTLLSSKWWRTSTCSLNLAFRTSHSVNDTYQRTCCGFSPVCSLDGPSMLDCPCCPCLSNRPPAMPSRDPRYASCSPYLPSTPLPAPLESWTSSGLWPFSLLCRDRWNTSHHLSQWPLIWHYLPLGLTHWKS